MSSSITTKPVHCFVLTEETRLLSFLLFLTPKDQRHRHHHHLLTSYIEAKARGSLQRTILEANNTSDTNDRHSRYGVVTRAVKPHHNVGNRGPHGHPLMYGQAFSSPDTYHVRIDCCILTYVGSILVANNFWGKEDAGVQPLLERMSAAKQTCDELRSFYAGTTSTTTPPFFFLADRSLY